MQRYLEQAVAVDQQVSGFDVSVQDPSGVQVLQTWTGNREEVRVLSLHLLNLDSAPSVSICAEVVTFMEERVKVVLLVSDDNV